MHNEPEKVSNDLNYFFIDTAGKTANKILPKNYAKQNIISKLHRNDVYSSYSRGGCYYNKKIKKQKSSGFDGISNNLIKYCSSELCLPLSLIINNSLYFGVFPEKANSCFASL